MKIYTKYKAYNVPSYLEIKNLISSQKELIDTNIEENFPKLSFLNTFTEVNYFSKGLNITGDILVNGNIVLRGKNYITHAQDLFTKQDVIHLREDSVLGLGENEYTGLVAERYDGENNGLLVFDRNGEARVGDEGDTQPLLTRLEEEDLPDGALLKWDASRKCAVPETNSVNSLEELQNDITALKELLSDLTNAGINSDMLNADLHNAFLDRNNKITNIETTYNQNTDEISINYDKNGTTYSINIGNATESHAGFMSSKDKLLLYETKEIEHPISVVDIDNADLIIADDKENPIVTFANGHIKTALFDSENIETSTSNVIKVADIDGAELIIADEDEYPILTVENGHIKTSKFDSSLFSLDGTIDISITSILRSLWNGKRAAIIGDSISDPSHIGTTKCWWEMFDDIGLSTTSYAVSGATILSMITQALSIIEVSPAYDIIFVFGGTNDYNISVPMGEWFTITDALTNKNGSTVTLKYRTPTTPGTFRGNLNGLLSTLKEGCPGVPIVLLTPLHRGYASFASNNVQPNENYANTLSLFINDYVDAVKLAASLWACHCVDLFSVSGLMPVLSVYSSYFNNADTDCLHPNLYGHLIIAKAIKHELLKVFLK